MVNLLLPRSHSFDHSTLAKIGVGEVLPQVQMLKFGERDVPRALEMFKSRQNSARKYGTVSCISDAVIYARAGDWGILKEVIDDLSSQGMSIRVKM